MKTKILRTLVGMAALWAVTGCNSGSKELSETADDAARRIEILFLGHAEEHHNSREYMPVLASALALQGINVTYTESVADLNPKNLEQYDGVLLYANHEGRHPAQERALMEYVAEGHAFIPVHCASFCFKDSPDYVALVGGQFKEHGTATFTTDIIAGEHPAMAHMEPFTTWDETYVHHQLAEDIEVLMERVDGDTREPWTWVREHGKGRVFYTAYGHDERTWSHPSFHELIKEGIVWAVGEQVRKNWAEFTKDIPRLVYEDRDSIPNYEKRTPAPKYQLPLSPEASQKLIQVPPGFELELFASEPDIINPIAMNWDEKGRLWVIETVDYPNTVRDDRGTGDDRIKICEDTNGDGKADTFTIFAEGLNIPTGFTFWKGGIMVSQAPYFLYLKDTDGDDRADVKEIIMDGWGTFDTHAGPSNLQMGLDNHLYGVVGYSGYKGPIFGKEYEFRQGMYRFDPAREYFEFLTNTSNNTWGLGMTEDNSLFASTANNTHSVFMGIPNSFFKEIEGIRPIGSMKIDGHYAMQPITRNIRQVDVFNGFTAASGHHFYTARAFPDSYWNRVAFVCEPTGGLVHMARIEQQGAGYVEKDGGNLFASADEWVSPVEAKVGPDGAVWILDWYNFIVQHNPTPSVERGGYQAENGEGNAYVNPLRDKTRGRIWRVIHKKAPGQQPFSLDINRPEELVAALANDNMFWRMTAQRLLVERGNKDVLPSLYRLINDPATDALGLAPAALHAVWTLSGLGVVPSDTEATAVVKGALFHPAAAVRKAALQVLPREPWVDEAVMLAGVLRDRDPKVQLAALLYLSERTASEETGTMLYELSRDVEVAGDPWLSQALYVAASSHSSGFIRAYLKDHPNYSSETETSADADPGILQGSALVGTFVRNYIDRVGPLTGSPAEDSATATVVVIGTIKNEMKYDVTEFVVQAGAPVELVFENTDFMQHNLVIVAPGTKEKVGLAADQLAMDPEGAAKNYIPELSEVLYATAIINPEDKVVLRFTAPAKAGEYPFICTFPGHWRIMQGVMKVVEAP